MMMIDDHHYDHDKERYKRRMISHSVEGGVLLVKMRQKTNLLISSVIRIPVLSSMSALLIVDHYHNHHNITIDHHY